MGVAAVVKTPTAVRVLSPRSISTEWRSRRVVCLPRSGGHGDGRNRLVFPCFFIRNMSLFNHVRWIINSFCSYCNTVVALLNHYQLKIHQFRQSQNNNRWDDSFGDWAKSISCLGYVGVMLGDVVQLSMWRPCWAMWKRCWGQVGRCWVQAKPLETGCAKLARDRFRSNLSNGNLQV